jgi:hypothetical protein
LPDVINTGFHFSHAYIDPDDRFLIFCSDRSGGYGEGDLYISFRKKDGTWTEAINLGPEINTEKLERSPHLSIDDKYLFFVRHKKIDNRYAEGNFYWVNAKIIDRFKSKID